jgi:acyl-CoA thioester hydrolase
MGDFRALPLIHQDTERLQKQTPADSAGNSETVEFTDPAAYRFWVDEHVRFQDLDPLGHANNNAFGIYFESGRVAFLSALGFKDGQENRGTVLARITIDFRAELRYADRIRIGSRILKVGRTSATLASAVFRDDLCAATCSAVIVLIDTESRRPTEFSQSARDRMNAYL